MIDLRKLRKRRGLTQPELAKLLGVVKNTISRWELGVHTPKGASRIALLAWIEKGTG